MESLTTRCGRVGCGQPAVAVLLIAPQDQQAWVVGLDHPAGLDGVALCAAHADRISVPFGWTLHDDRPAPRARPRRRSRRRSGDDLAEPADASPVDAAPAHAAPASVEPSPRRRSSVAADTAPDDTAADDVPAAASAPVEIPIVEVSVVEVEAAEITVVETSVVATADPNRIDGSTADDAESAEVLEAVGRSGPARVDDAAPADEASPDETASAADEPAPPDEPARTERSGAAPTRRDDGPAGDTVADRGDVGGDGRHASRRDRSDERPPAVDEPTIQLPAVAAGPAPAASAAGAVRLSVVPADDDLAKSFPVEESGQGALWAPTPPPEHEPDDSTPLLKRAFRVVRDD